MANPNDVPRRICLPKNKPAELAIRNAISEVEKMGANVILTNIVIELTNTLNKLSDFIDNEVIDSKWRDLGDLFVGVTDEAGFIEACQKAKDRFKITRK